MKRILIVDNYDSFTYNLVQLVEQILGARVAVHRNDELEPVAMDHFDGIILSPGPGIPEEAGSLLSLIRTYAGRIPMLGVCLGHQAIGQVFGGKLINLDKVFHGVASTIFRSDGISGSSFGNDWFIGLPNEIVVGRYHSWVVSPDAWPDCLEITARDAEGHVMALRHREYDIQGVQFHPESILTPLGRDMLRNWLKK